MNSKIKKAAALLLAAVFIFQTAVLKIPSAYGASLGFTIYTDRQLIPGTTGTDAPVIGAAVRSMMFSWNAEVGQNMFRAPLDNGEVLYALVTRFTNGITSVSYAIGNAREGDLSGNLINTYNPPTIFCSNASSSDRYVPFGTYNSIALYNNIRTGFDIFSDPGSSIFGGNEPGYPADGIYTFTIGSSAYSDGLMTRYGRYEIAFLNDGATFYLSVGAIGERRIYDFSLHYHRNTTGTPSDAETLVAVEAMITNSAVDVERLNAYRGLEPDTIVPFAKLRESEIFINSAGLYAEAAANQPANYNVVHTTAGTNNILTFTQIAASAEQPRISVVMGTGSNPESNYRLDILQYGTDTTAGVYRLTFFSDLHPGNTLVVNEKSFTIDNGLGPRDQINGNVNDILRKDYMPSQDEDPATDINGLIVTFVMPQRWNESLLRFEAIDVDNTAKLMATINLTDMNSANGTPPLTVQIPNICRPITSGSSNAVYEKIGDYGRLVISGLPPGVMYSARISTGPTVNETSDIRATVTVSRNGIFTLLPYELVYIEGSYSLKIRPYRHTGFYTVMTDDSGKSLQSDSGNIVSYKLYNNDIDGDKEFFYLPVDINKNDPTGIRIYFTLAPTISALNPNIAAKSQIMLVPFESRIMGFSPRGLVIEKAETSNVPTYDLAASAENYPSANKESYMKLELSWDIGNANELKDYLEANGGIGYFYYNLNGVQSPVLTNQMFTFDTLEVKLELTDGGSTIEVTYNPNDTSEFIITGTDTFVINETNMLRGYVTLSMRAGNSASYPSFAPAAGVNGDMLFFYYPGIYFIKFDMLPYANALTITASSNYAPFALSSAGSSKLPEAQNLVAVSPITDDTQVSFTARWRVPADGILSYLNIFDYEKNAPDDPKLSYSLYVAQSDLLLRNIDPAIVTEVDYSTVADVSGIYPVIYFSDINGQNGFDAGGRDGRSVLRSGEIICITGIPSDIAPGLIQIKLDGLDKNQRYFISAKTTLDFIALYPDSPPEPLTMESGMSNIAAIITAPDKTQPKPGESDPPAPANLIWDTQDNPTTSTNAAIRWDQVQDDGVVSYEIVRSTARPINPGLLSDRSLTLEEFLDLIESMDPRAVLEAVETSKIIPGADDERHTYNEADVYSYYKDNALRPNTVYYYYVRTVREFNGVKYSEWVGIAVTTQPVGRPLNLVVLRENVIYDGKTEAWISFIAPVGANLGTDYFLEYRTKAGGVPWGDYVVMDSAELIAGSVALTGSLEGYYRYTYKITGLKHGTSYSIVVRMVDALGDASIDSNIALTRTELDQDEYDRDKETQDWLDYLKDRLADIYKTPAWPVTDSRDFLSMVYSPSMFLGVLNETKDSEISLIAPDSGRARSFTYYLPGQIMERLWQSNKTLTVTCGDMKVFFNKNFIDVSYNEAVIQVKRSIQMRRDADYFIKIDVFFTNNNINVNGETPIGYRTELSAEIVAVSKEIRIWDNEILRMYTNKIADEVTIAPAIADLREMADNGADFVDRVLYVEEFVELVRQDLIAETMESLIKIINSSTKFTAFNQSVAVSIKTGSLSDVVNGYQRRVNSWGYIPARDYMGMKALFAATPGFYAFTSLKADLPGIENITMSGGDSDSLLIIAAKYGLEEFLGGSSFSMSGDVSLSSLINIAARLSGADKNSDHALFLRQKGFVVPGRGTRPATTEEMLYWGMAVYSIKTGIKAESILIRNFTAAANIKDINPNYLRSVQSAYELGLYSNSNLFPQAPVKTSDLLLFISNLNKHVKF
ncbi:MAG: hypothetical protein FWE82_01730 [Defluviitaleaceae bacterium]|nr:hypothetical protein [Defluviitaleaceae bacterium]